MEAAQTKEGGQRPPPIRYSLLPIRVRDSRQAAANFTTLIASKFCTPPPTRLVV